jgi:hypothetical protein
MLENVFFLQLDEVEVDSSQLPAAGSWTLASAWGQWDSALLIRLNVDPTQSRRVESPVKLPVAAAVLPGCDLELQLKMWAILLAQNFTRVHQCGP